MPLIVTIKTENGIEVKGTTEQWVMALVVGLCNSDPALAAKVFQLMDARVQPFAALPTSGLPVPLVKGF